MIPLANTAVLGRDLERAKNDYWISKSKCYYNAFYNTRFLKNDKDHFVRAGELFVNGVQKTDGELDWKVKDFNDNLSNSHFWVETADGKIIDWMANFFMKTLDNKVWDKAELEARGIVHIPYIHEKEIIEKGKELYGDTGEKERKIGKEMKKCWID
jgi:hypothetical protein